MHSRINRDRSYPEGSREKGWEANLVRWWRETPELSADAPQYSERLVGLARRCAGIDMFRSSQHARVEWAEGRGVDGFDDLKGIYRSLAQIASNAPRRFVEAEGKTADGSLARFFEAVPDTSKQSGVSDTVGDFLVSCLEQSPENTRALATQCRELVDKIASCWRELAEVVVPENGVALTETDPTAAIRQEAHALLRKVKEAEADLADGLAREDLIEQVTKVGGFLRLQLEPLFFENSEIDESTAAAEFWQEAGRIAQRIGVKELTAAAQILEQDLERFVGMLDVLEGIEQGLR